MNIVLIIFHRDVLTDYHGNEEYKRARLNGHYYNFILQAESSSSSSQLESDQESGCSWQNQETGKIIFLPTLLN